MSVQTNIIIIVTALIIALERTAFSVVKRHDRAAGLYLNDSAYTLLGTIRLLFMKQDKRILKETEITFDDYLDENPQEKKKFKLFAFSYTAALVALSVYQCMNSGFSNMVITNLCMAVMGLCFAASKSLWIIILILLYGLFSAIYATGVSLIPQLIVLIAGIVLTVKYIALREKYRKEIKDNKNAKKEKT